MGGWFNRLVEQVLPGIPATSFPPGLNGGNYLGITVKTTGALFTTGPLTNKIKIRLTGGGGGGGGCTTAGVSGAAGGGGSSGGYAEKTFTVTPSTGYVCAIGAFGAGGTNAGTNGSAGTDSTFTVGAVTVTAKGGNGGQGMLAGVVTAFSDGGLPPAVSTFGDINTSGEPGQPGILVSGTVGGSGDGGSYVLGSGAGSAVAAAAGTAPLGGYGGGGSGGLVLNGSPAVAGGNGAAGAIVIEEYS